MGRVELPSHVVTCSFKNVYRPSSARGFCVGWGFNAGRSKSGNHYAGDTKKHPSIIESKRKGRRKISEHYPLPDQVNRIKLVII